jgi:hypothetical protein
MVHSLRTKTHARWAQAADRFSAPLKLPQSFTLKDSSTHVKVMPLWEGSDQKKYESIGSTDFMSLESFSSSAAFLTN